MDPSAPSSIFDNLSTSTLGSPSTLPFNIPAICAAVNFILAKVKKIVSILMFRIADIIFGYRNGKGANIKMIGCSNHVCDFSILVKDTDFTLFIFISQIRDLPGKNKIGSFSLSDFIFLLHLY